MCIYYCLIDTKLKLIASHYMETLFKIVISLVKHPDFLLNFKISKISWSSSVRWTSTLSVSWSACFDTSPDGHSVNWKDSSKCQARLLRPTWDCRLVFKRANKPLTRLLKIIKMLTRWRQRRIWWTVRGNKVQCQPKAQNTHKLILSQG